MPAVRRHTDDPGENHYQSGERQVDWRMSPRPVLVVAIYVLMGMLSFLGSFSYWVLADKIAKIEANGNDTKWNVLLEHSYDIGELKRRAQQDAELRQQMQELRAEVREVRRLVQKRR
jgi:hypothetical protein